jgi:hypothetical protein
MGGNTSSPKPYDESVYGGGFEYLADTEHTESVAVFTDETFSLSTPCGLELRRRFGGIKWLQGQGIKAGNILALQYNGRYVYYLIVSKNSYVAADPVDFAAAVTALAAHMNANNVTKVVVENVLPKWINMSTFETCFDSALGDPRYAFYNL